MKICQCLAVFSNLTEFQLNSVHELSLMLKFLTKAQISFKQTLTSLVVNACFIKEENMGEFFPLLSDFILSFPNLSYLRVSGMRIGDHLGDLVPAFKNSKIKSLILDLNGIEPESCLYLNYIINFEHL